MHLFFGTDSGPKHTCGCTIYRYDAKSFEYLDGETRTETTVFATCVVCNRNASMFRMHGIPDHVAEVRAAHHHAGNHGQ